MSQFPTSPPSTESTPSVGDWSQSIIAQRLHVSYDAIVEFCDRWHIIELALFGSILRDDFRADSDVDILVVFDPNFPRSPFHRLQTQAALENY
ncbi:MAG: DNA polymerase subunit beta [Merismopedia sp. SIO2A8]|nr:DNA polymerase subunit beta [Merismopedia sp. SIO2A8]